MTSNIGSTQTIVTFLMQPSPGVFVESKRIFELEISQAAADHFSEMMAKLKENLDILALAVESGTLPDHNHEIGIVQGILAALDNWSKMIRINQQGEQVTTNPYFIPLQFDTSGAPIPGTGVRTDLPFYDTVAGTAVAIENSDCISNIDTTMTRYMAEALDQIVRTIRAAGADPIHLSGSALDAISLLLGEQKETYGLSAAIERGVSAAEQALVKENAFSQSESLQQLLMVDYISRGNELLFNEMSSLKDAININQEVLSYLNSLQDLMNQKDPQHFIMQLQYLLGSTSDDETSWQEFEKETFNQELGTEAKLPGFSEDEIAAYVSMIYGWDPASGDQPFEHGEVVGEGTDTAGTAAGAFVDVATFTFNAGWETIRDNLVAYKDRLALAAGDDGTPLSQQLEKIINDFETHPNIQTWIQDYESGQEGEFQRHLNDAVVASQALNDTEREELRRVMFVYEEFYKSATAMLSRMTQIIERMAAAISR